MASAFKCDICGGLYEGYDGLQYKAFGNYFNTIEFCNRSMARRFDTCPSCMQSLMDFMRSRENITASRKENHD